MHEVWDEFVSIIYVHISNDIISRDIVYGACELTKITFYGLNDYPVLWFFI